MKNLPIIMILLCSFAYGDQPAATDDVITVTAERGIEKLDLETPQSVSVIDRASLDAQVAVTANDVIESLPGVGLGPAGETLSFWQRGYTIRGLGSQRVLTLSDGVRLSGQGTGYGGGSLSLYDVFAVERIEVLRGPNSVLYGTDAFGGVVNFITRSPQRRELPGINSAVGVAYNDAYGFFQKNAYIDAGHNTAGIVLGGSSSTNDNPKLANGERATSGATDRSSVFAHARYDLDPQRTVRLIVNSSRDRNVEIESSAIPFGPVGQGPLEFAFPLYQRQLASANYTRTHVGRLLTEYSLSLSHQTIQRQFDRTTPEVSVIQAPGQRPSARVESVQVITDDSIRITELGTQQRWIIGNHQLVSGIDLGRDSSTGPESEIRTQLWPLGNDVPTDPVSRQRVDAQQYRIGAYLQDRISLSSNTDLVLGGRFDQFRTKDNLTDQTNNSQGFSGTAAVIRRLGSDFSVYANAGLGYRVPDLGERYQQSLVSVVSPVLIIGNPDLDPERSRSADIGFKGQVTERLRTDAAVFYTSIKDYIAPRIVSEPGAVLTVEQSFNTTTVDIWGWELSAVYEWQQFEFAGSISDSESTNHKNLVRSTGLGGSLSVTWNHRLASITANMESSQSSEDLTELARETGSSVRRHWPGYTVFGASATTNIAVSSNLQLDLVIGVNNLTNKQYRAPFLDQVQVARSVFASATVRF